MRALFFILLVFSFTSFGQQSRIFLGYCEVEQAYSSFIGTFAILRNCDGNLGFQSKVLQLIYEGASASGFKTQKSNEPLIFRDSVSVILGLEHTVELARLTQRKLRIQLDEAREKVLFLSLADPLRMECSKPPVLPPNPNPNPEPTPSPDDFHPVPPPPKRPAASMNFSWKNWMTEINQNLSALTTAEKKDAETGITGDCEVSGVYSGPGGNFVELVNCKGDLGFKSKMMKLPTEKNVLIQTGNPSGDLVYSKQKLVILGMIQTAELAHLFHRRLDIELESVDGTPKFFALLEGITSFCP